MSRQAWMTYGRLFCGVWLFLVSTEARADDVHLALTRDQLTITEGEFPTPTESAQARWNSWQHREYLRAFLPYARLDGVGEIYLDPDAFVPAELRQDDPTANAPAAVALRTPAGKEITGSLFVPNADFDGMVRLRFRVPAKAATDEKSARQTFLKLKAAHYRELQARNVAGTAWFRHQAREAERELGITADTNATDTTTSRNFPPAPDTDFEDSFGFFTGGQAIAENLQLDRTLNPGEGGEPTVDISTLEGITIAEFDWAKRTENLSPALDPLASHLPADQHALFIPGLTDLGKLLKLLDRVGDPLSQSLTPRSEDARLVERYSQQLALPTDALLKPADDGLIRSLVLTGSDPYFASGTDVALLFATTQPDRLAALLIARQQVVAAETAAAKLGSGKVAGLEYNVVATPDRRVSSFVARVGDAVLVTNSPVQLERFAEVANGKRAPLASLPEYRFFRHRYPLSETNETAFLMLTDATIRRWCSPRWRIAASRRTRALALLADLQARHARELVAGTAKDRTLETGFSLPEIGTVSLEAAGVRSSNYGTLYFVTPIAELQFTHVTTAEAEAYTQWRDTYQRYWRQFFDPIAIRLEVGEEQLTADVSVMPLIANSEYAGFIQVVSGAALKPDSGDRHPEALIHWAMAINTKSEAMRQLNGFLQNFGLGLLSWLGDSISLYADADPFWADLAKVDAQEQGTFMEQQLHRLPVAFRAEVRDSLKLAAFLTGLRALVENAAPNLVSWETHRQGDLAYVRIAPMADARRNLGGLSEEFAIYYATTPGGLTITPSEALIKRVLDREAARRKAADQETTNEPQDRTAREKDLLPWIGESMALQVDGQVLQMLKSLLDDDYHKLMQVRAWSNLPILNEWKRLAPNRDPLDVHRQLWSTRLRSPGGEGYVWNEEWRTMESIEYGHPGAPKSGPGLPSLLDQVRSMNFGVTFEEQGLRARGELGLKP